MVQVPLQSDTLYPDSDGKPMADNTMQFRWITRLVTNLKLLLNNQAAFVAGDLLWYPVQVVEPPVPSQAPDVMVVLGRPDGDRGSYKQWEEAGIAPQVVFEIISPGNSSSEMGKKQIFYTQYGVLEQYFYNPDSFDFWGLVRDTVEVSPRLITSLDLPWRSPLLEIEFKLFEDGLAVFDPDGQEFKDSEVIGQERDRFAAKLRELGIDPDTL